MSAAENTRVVRVLVLPASIVVVVGLALAIWLRMEPLAFVGGDGKTFQTYISSYLRYGGLFEVNRLMPLQGAFAPQLPLSTWLNPGYLVFRVLGSTNALVASLMVSFLALAIPTYFLGRAAGLGRGAAALAAQATIAVFPPFLNLLGFGSQYALVPPTATALGLMTLAPVVVLRLHGARLIRVTLAGFGVAAIVYASFLLDPGGLLHGLISTLPFLVIFAASGGDRPVVTARVAALLLAGVVVYLLRVTDFVRGFLQFTARYVFRAEIGRPQVPSEVSALFNHPLLFGVTLMVLAAGWILALRFTRAERRWLALACIVHWILLIGVQGTLYLFSSKNWRGLVPLDLEQAAYHLYILGAASGWSAATERLAVATGRRVSGAALAALALVPVPLGLAVYGAFAAAPAAARDTEPWAEQDCLTRALGPVVALDPRHDPAFRGSVVVLDGPKADDHRAQTLNVLWSAAIPTLNEYFPLVTPPMYHFATRVMGSVPALDALPFVPGHDRLLALLGVRFALAGDSRPVPGARPLRRCDGRDSGRRPLRWYVHEIAEPNLGHYSPTDLRPAPDLAAMIALMSQPDLDPRRTVVIGATEQLPPLTPATRAELVVERGWIRVTAQSDGDSLLVLPIQFSRCLRLAGGGSARLIRADLLLTGLVFRQFVTVELVHDFGFFTPRCRRADHEELRALGFAPDPRWEDPHRHPLAVRKLAEVPSRLREVARQLRQNAEADRREIVRLFGG